MTNNKILCIVMTVLVLVIIGGGLFIFFGNRDTRKETQTPAAENEMVDCSKMEDPYCFLNRMTECSPVTAKLTGTDGATDIEITILGIENETCHFQRKINNVLNLDCYFPKGTLNTDTLDQIFGNDKGLQKVVDAACKSVGW